MFHILLAEDGRIAYDSFCEERFDLVITDVMMPRMDGNELTALEAIDDKEKGFNAGADDYLVRPFALKELVLRVKALLRRYCAVSENKIILPHTELNYNTNTAIIGSQQIELTKKEFQLLLALLGAIVCIVMAVTLVGSILTMVLDEQLMMSAMYISQLIILILMTLAFHYIVDSMIVRRISRLNDAMSRVAEGDYEISVPVEGNDELSRLTESFDGMTNELKMNAFLSKDFARYVSHEFKTPLAVIRSYAER